MQAKNIKERLKSLIEKASAIDPSLVKRLNQIYRWVKDVKPGSLNAKPYVILFLRQLINDAETRLDIKGSASEEEQQAYFAAMTPTEKYWYGELFPKWLTENDPNFLTWRRKLMAGDFSQEDATLINSITKFTKQRGGTVVQRYVADLAMATDIIVSSRQEQPLCIQLTSLSQEFSLEKSIEWEEKLVFWGIERGLFLSYNPGTTDFVNQIVNLALDNSDNIQTGIYLKLNL
ncbi:hypothetical protein Cylst_5028 [Cylindrospermum stagnale PCC 7417]|uniref:Uncharacterized protein n=1 Tax=Cylindrospermum stagnale PCC 7417 TaxID=56107 RepID=K9X3R4_9NOST|nr:hypothetical protein [Cylindrospermum stagnale]AFZ27078.1 hypothetical protein Cylst_5028 [Cylindrospermum stagnale PCC 7417]